MNIREQSGLFLFATLFTLLIWLWAEGENRASRSLDVVLQFTCDTDTDPFLLRIRDPEDSGHLLDEIEIKIDLEGPNLPLTRFARERTSLRVNLPAPVDGQEQEIDLMAVIQGLPGIDDAGLTVLGTSPRTLTARFDQLTTRSVPISRTVPGYEFESIVVVPDQVDLTLPSVMWATLGEDFVHLELPTTRLRAMAPGESQTFDQVSLRLDDRIRTLDGVQLPKSTVSVTVALVDRTVQTTRVVPVRISKPSRSEQAYEVIVSETEEVIHDVIVSGDSAQITRLENGEITIYAMLYLTSDELEQKIESKAVEWILPEGLKVIKAGDQPTADYSVEIRIIERSAES